MQALNDVVKAGYVRYIGMSSCFAWQCAYSESRSLERELNARFPSPKDAELRSCQRVDRVRLHAELPQCHISRGGARDGPSFGGPRCWDDPLVTVGSRLFDQAYHRGNRSRRIRCVSDQLRLSSLSAYPIALNSIKVHKVCRWRPRRNDVLGVDQYEVRLCSNLLCFLLPRTDLFFFLLSLS